MNSPAYRVFVEKQRHEKLSNLPPFTHGISLQGFFLAFKEWAMSGWTKYPSINNLNGFSDEFTVHGNAVMYVANFTNSTRGDFDRMALELGGCFVRDGKPSDFPLSMSGLTTTGKGLAVMWWIENQIEENV